MGVGHVRVDIPLGRGELGVPHDLLDHAGRDLGHGQRCGSSVPAGIRRQITDAGALQGSVVFIVEVILVHSEQIPAAALCGSNQVIYHRDNRLRVDDGRLFAFPGLQAAAENLPLLGVNHIYLAALQLAGHHAGVDHQQDQPRHPVPGAAGGPEPGHLLVGKGLPLCFRQGRDTDELRQVRPGLPLCHSPLEQMGQERPHIPRRVVGLRLIVHAVLQISYRQQGHRAVVQLLQLAPGNAERALL